MFLYRTRLTKIEARFAGAVYSSNSVIGVLNTCVGFQTNSLNQNEAASHLAVIPEHLISTGDQGVALDRIEPQARVTRDYDLTDSPLRGGTHRFADRRNESSEEHSF